MTEKAGGWIRPEPEEIEAVENDPKYAGKSDAEKFRARKRGSA